MALAISNVIARPPQDTEGFYTFLYASIPAGRLPPVPSAQLTAVNQSSSRGSRNTDLFFHQQWQKLLDPLVWLDAATQIFFSLGVAFGTIVAYASYNPIHENTLRDAVGISVTNCLTSLFAAVVVFSILGFRWEAFPTHISDNRQKTGKAYFIHV